MFLVNCVVLFVLSYTIYMALSIYFLKGSCFQICEERAHIREEEIKLRRGAGGEAILSSSPIYDIHAIRDVCLNALCKTIFFILVHLMCT